MVLLKEGADDTEKDGVIVGAKIGNDDDWTTEGVADGSLEGSSDGLMDG